MKALSDDGVLVSLGHSDATAYDAHLAFDAGARTVTHLFNAMSAMRHREPGLPGAALSRPDVVVQMVLDGHHLSPDVVRVVWAAAAPGGAGHRRDGRGRSPRRELRARGCRAGCDRRRRPQR